MDISCNIIRDLLPLYAEDMVSEDSKKMVDDHLCGCDDCTKELAAIKKAPKVPLEVDVKSLKRVGDTIRRRRILTVAAAIMTLLAVVVTGFVFMLTPYAMTAEEAIEGAELTEDGGLAIDFSRGVQGTAGWGIYDEDNNGIMCHTNRYDQLQANRKDAEIEGMTQEALEAYIAELYDVEECTQRDWNRFFSVSVDYGTFRTKDGEELHNYDPEIWTEENGEWVYRPADENHWYLNSKNGDVDTLIWDGGQEYPNSILWTANNFYGIVFYGCAVLAMVFFVISRGIAGIWKEILIRLAIALGGIAFSTLLVTNGQFSVLDYYLNNEWNEAIYIESVFVALTALLWHQLHRLNKLSKGM